jgi:seryl-tRNA synthetase
MLDIRFIRENPQLVAEKSKQKGYDIDIDQLLGFDKKRSELLQKVEDLRRQRNELADKGKKERPSEDEMSKGRELKDQLAPGNGASNQSLILSQKPIGKLPKSGG